MKSVKDYHNLYLNWDVSLLANLFEKTKDSSLKSYGLCPRYYLKAPGLNCDSMLSMTKVEIELI